MQCDCSESSARGVHDFPLALCLAGLLVSRLTFCAVFNTVRSFINTREVVECNAIWRQKQNKTNTHTHTHTHTHDGGGAEANQTGQEKGKVEGINKCTTAPKLLVLQEMEETRAAMNHPVVVVLFGTTSMTPKSTKQHEPARGKEEGGGFFKNRSRCKGGVNIQAHRHADTPFPTDIKINLF